MTTSGAWLEIRPGLRGRFVRGDVGWSLVELAREDAWREARADAELAQPTREDRRIAFTTPEQGAHYFAAMDRIAEAHRAMVRTRPASVSGDRSPR